MGTLITLRGSAPAERLGGSVMIFDGSNPFPYRDSRFHQAYQAVLDCDLMPAMYHDPDEARSSLVPGAEYLALITSQTALGHNPATPEDLIGVHLVRQARRIGNIPVALFSEPPGVLDIPPGMEDAHILPHDPADNAIYSDLTRWLKANLFASA